MYKPISKPNTISLADLLKLAREKKTASAIPIPAPVQPVVQKATSASQRARDILAKKLAKKTAPIPTMAIPVPIEEPIPVPIEEPTQEQIPPIQNTIATGMHGEAIEYNAEQQKFIDIASSGRSCVLIGAAGTGKTTCSQGTIKALINRGVVSILKGIDHKYLSNGSPGIVITAYTRRATNNIRKVMSNDLKGNCITAHKLLEYAPEYYTVEDPVTKKIKNTMRFIPSRCATNPLPSGISTIVVEEGSMLSYDLFQEINVASQHEIQWIFLGDINQLPPIFGPAILGFKLNELPVVELTHVYRQALESPIIKLAHRILSGIPIPPSEFPAWKVENKLTLHPWKKKLDAELAVLTLAEFFKAAITRGVYDTEEDIILMPHNKSCGTLELNKHIANFLAKKRGAKTHEVIAGYIKHYFSEGDKVLFDREDAEIISIGTNMTYTGARVQPASRNLDYWGHNPKLVEEFKDFQHIDEDAMKNIDFLLEAAAGADDRVNQSSHVITVRLLDTNQTVSLSKAAEVNGLLHSYALTVHKAQGSEWRKVFLVFHQSHAAMLQRELLYTAVTRAKEELYIICEPESFIKGIKSQRIKGTTLVEKAEFFKGKSKGRDNISEEEE